MGFLLQGEITKADATIIWMETTPSRLTGDPTSNIPTILCLIPFLPQPSQFILACDRHQVCWFAYWVAWL